MRRNILGGASLMSGSELFKSVLTDLDWLFAAFASIVVGVLSLLGKLKAEQRVAAILLVLGTISFAAWRNREATEELQESLRRLEATQELLVHGKGLLADHHDTGVTRVFATPPTSQWPSLIREAHPHDI